MYTGLANGNNEMNTLRLQQALQALNLQQQGLSNNTPALQNLGQNLGLQNYVVQQRQRESLEAWNKQQQQQSQQNAFHQNQGLRAQDQSRFAAQFGGAQRATAQNPFHQNLGTQTQNQIFPW